MNAINPTYPYNNRIIIDSNYVVSASVPVAPLASVTGSTTSINLKNTVPFPVMESFIVSIFSTLTTGITGSVAVGLQHSSDNSTFSNIPQFTSSLVTINGVSGTGSAATTYVYLPPDVKEYIRAFATSPISASVGAGTTGSFGFQFQF